MTDAKYYKGSVLGRRYNFGISTGEGKWDKRYGHIWYSRCAYRRINRHSRSKLILRQEMPVMAEDQNRTKPVWPWFVAFLIGMLAMGISVDMLDVQSKAIASGLMIIPMILLIPMVRNAMSNAKREGAAGDPVRRYLVRMVIVSLAYLGSLFLASQLIERGGEVSPLAVTLALIPGLAVTGYFWAIGRLIVEQKDEFQRMLVVRQSLIATALALSLASIWGFLENFELVQHVDAYWWPIVWFFGLGVGAIFNKIQLGTAGETM